ncbi:MAG: GGDEF domain-containing protein [Planctomycetes bacterium]|nr:GGDEF domain-containing protein [Planctomycetota bacterium]
MNPSGAANKNGPTSLLSDSDPSWDAAALLEAVPDAMLILDADRRNAIGANQELASLLGVAPAARTPAAFDPGDLIHSDDHARFHALGDPGKSDPGKRVMLRLLCKDGVALPVEACGRFLPAGRSGGRWVYFFRPLVAFGEAEGVPGEQMFLQKKRTVEAVKASLRIYQLTEKVRSAPKLSTLLLDVRSEEELFRRAGNFLVSDGMNYEEAAIFLLDGESLHLRYSSSNRSHLSYDVRKENRYARFLQTGEQPSEYENVQLVALRTKGEPIGVLEVLFDPRERALFQENQLIVEWSNDVLDTIAEILTLFLDNIRLYQKLRKQTILDPLTSVYNRHYLLTHLEAEIDKARKLERPLSLIFTDVDGFKQVNDFYGHQNGDLIIQEIAFLLQNSMRESDCICRYGGDEFVIMLPNTTMQDAERKAEHLLRTIESHPFNVRDPKSGETRTLKLSMSAGVASADGGGGSHEVLQGADLALYGAKRKGKNCVYRIESGAVEEQATLRLSARRATRLGIQDLSADGRKENPAG